MFFPPEKQEKRGICPYFGTLTDQTIAGKLTFTSAAKKGRSGNENKMCENKSMEIMENSDKNSFNNNGRKHLIGLSLLTPGAPQSQPKVSFRKYVHLTR